jgi:hypothetical protein
MQRFSRLLIATLRCVQLNMQLSSTCDALRQTNRTSLPFKDIEDMRACPGNHPKLLAQLLPFGNAAEKWGKDKCA